MSKKILLVDDDAHILRGYTRQLHDIFQIVTAPGGLEGLQAIESQGPFAVVVADMRMPRMDGIQFLAITKERAPNTVRIMLTGNADMQTAINAVNAGNIFRFLTKPCPIDIFINSLNAGIEQYQLVTAKQELLEKTLNGSLNVLIEVLSLASPAAFSRTTRLTKLAVEIVTHLQVPEIWRFKVATMLSQIGCITLPPTVFDKLENQLPLSDQEKEMLADHPAVGAQLLAHIPRLELIAKMIEGQHEPPYVSVAPNSLDSDRNITAFGAQLLKLVLDFDQQLIWGMSEPAALSILQGRTNQYNPHLLAALKEVTHVEADGSLKEVTVKELKVGMIIDRDVEALNGNLLVHEGQEVSLSVLLRLRNFARGVGVQEPIRVRVPLFEEDPEPALAN